MSLFASPGFSAGDAQAGENRGGMAAHKYEGLTSFQRTIPRLRKHCGDTAICGDLTARGSICAAGKGVKIKEERLIS